MRASPGSTGARVHTAFGPQTVVEHGSKNVALRRVRIGGMVHSVGGSTYRPRSKALVASAATTMGRGSPQGG
eukprot:2588887-Pleurochrysis_carterae.AAC.2